jgi:hypothetical protein
LCFLNNNAKGNLKMLDTFFFFFFFSLQEISIPNYDCLLVKIIYQKY